MNEFERGMQVGLQMAIDLEQELRKSPAFFLRYEDYKAYKEGILEYKAKLEELRDV